MFSRLTKSTRRTCVLANEEAFQRRTLAGVDDADLLAGLALNAGSVAADTLSRLDLGLDRIRALSTAVSVAPPPEPAAPELTATDALLEREFGGAAVPSRAATAIVFGAAARRTFARCAAADVTLRRELAPLEDWLATEHLLLALTGSTPLVAVMIAAGLTSDDMTDAVLAVLRDRDRVRVSSP
jgi:hypothetical protein